MCRFWVIMICAALSTLFYKADDVLWAETASQEIPSHLLRHDQTFKIQNTSDVKLHYGFSQLTFTHNPGEQVKIVHLSSVESSVNPFVFIKSAEADQGNKDFTISGFAKICNTVNETVHLDDLKTVLSRRYFDQLQDKVSQGASAYVVLAMLQAMRPSDIYILDYHVEKDRAELSVKGKSSFGLTQGLVKLIKEDSVWKIDQEEWYASNNGDERKFWEKSLMRLSSVSLYSGPSPSGILAQISPDSRFNTNILDLNKVPYQKNGRAFNFVFLMKKDKNNTHKVVDVNAVVQSAYQKANGHSTNIHILWTGTKKLIREQKIVEHQYPVNFSVANFDDGYSAGQWNLILPSKKPREIVVSLLWNF